MKFLLFCLSLTGFVFSEKLVSLPENKQPVIVSNGTLISSQGDSITVIANPQRDDVVPWESVSYPEEVKQGSEAEYEKLRLNDYYSHDVLLDQEHQ